MKLTIDFDNTTFEIRISKMNYKGYEEASLEIIDTWEATTVYEDNEFELPYGSLTDYLEEIISELSY